MLSIDYGDKDIIYSNQFQLDIDTVIGNRRAVIQRPFTIVKEKIHASAKEPKHFHIDYIYVGVAPSRDTIILPEESEGEQWFELTETSIDSLQTFPTVKAVFKKILLLKENSVI